jgi:hypothetical protein
MMRRFSSSCGAIVVIALICSCSADEDSGVSIERQNHRGSAVVGMQQTGDAWGQPAGLLFYVDANGIILSSEPLWSMDCAIEALSENDALVLRRGGIVEIRNRSIIERMYSSFGANDPSISPSDIDVIGLMTYDECMLQCCGSPNCDWGRLKYCLSKCAEDHDPKDPMKE